MPPDDATRRDWAWARKYDDRLQMIALKALRVSRIAPADDDLRHATDYQFQFLWQADEPRRRIDIAGRVRRPSYAIRYPDDITFRYQRSSGAPTEYQKILQGYADVAVYAIAKDNGVTDALQSCVVVNLELFRSHVHHGGAGQGLVTPNWDGKTALIPWDLKALAACPTCLGMVLYHEGHLFTLDERFHGARSYADFIARLRSIRHGCARWLDAEARFCNRTDGLRDYEVGPLCPAHQPPTGGKS